MKLSKFFRKYNRMLILVFMSLLLVAFLLTDVISSWSRRRRTINADLGTAFEGQAITTTDLNGVRVGLAIAGRFEIVDPSTDPVDAYLRREEVRRLGIRVGQATVKDALSGLGATDGTIQGMTQHYDCSKDYVFEVVGTWLAVWQMRLMLGASVGLSLPRLELAYRDRYQQAVVKLSVIDSTAFVNAVPEPSEEELTKYYEEAKERETAHTDTELVFGYRQPDRVQIEYLTVDPDTLVREIRVSKTEARRYFELHRSDYDMRVPRPGTRDAQGRPQYDNIPQAYEDVETRVKEDCRKAKAIEEAQRRVRELREEARRAWEGAEIGEDGYRRPPAEDLTGLFEELRDKHTTGAGVIYKKTELLDRGNVGTERGFGQASYGTGGARRVSAAELITRVKGLHEIEEDDPIPAFNLFEPSPIIFEIDRSSGGQTARQAYFYRVIRIVPSGPPDALDDVREQLVSDLKDVKAHEMAEVHARQLFQSAEKSGLAAAVAEAESLRALLARSAELDAATTDPPVPARKPKYLAMLGPFTPTDFTRSQPYVLHEGVFFQSPELPKRVFELAEREPTSTQAAHGVVLVQVATDKKWVLAELGELKPMYAGDFQQQRANLIRTRGQQEYRAFLLGWYNSDLLRQRTGYQPGSFGRPEE